MTSISGGCLCGAVRYTIEGPEQFSSVCHCKDCQKQTGTSFSIITGYSQDALSLTGELSCFSAAGESGKMVHRNFCPKCGSPVTTTVDVMPGMVFIKAGTMDDTSGLNPQLHIYCDSRQTWFDLPKDAQISARSPGG